MPHQISHIVVYNTTPHMSRHLGSAEINTHIPLAMHISMSESIEIVKHNIDQAPVQNVQTQVQATETMN